MEAVGFKGIVKLAESGDAPLNSQGTPSTARIPPVLGKWKFLVLGDFPSTGEILIFQPEINL